jgi:hypothetical protein
LFLDWQGFGPWCTDCQNTWDINVPNAAHPLLRKTLKGVRTAIPYSVTIAKTREWKELAFKKNGIVSQYGLWKLGHFCGPLN